MTMRPVSYAIWSPPDAWSTLGDLGLVATPAGELLRVDFLRSWSSIPHWTDSLAAMNFEPRRDDAVLEPAAAQLSEYFTGERREFDLDLAAEGGGFETRVWRRLLEIPYGVTWSYGRLADAVDDPDAARAVGAAVGHNPIPIVIPCHRVIGADGSLVGYGGGLDIKERLLLHEGALLCPLPKPIG